MILNSNLNLATKATSTIKQVAPVQSFLLARNVSVLAQALRTDAAATRAPATPTPVAAADPVTKATYTTAGASFGTMRHIDPIHDHFVNTLSNIEHLRNIATQGKTAADSLLGRVESYLRQKMGDDAYVATLSALKVSAPPSMPTVKEEELRGRFFSAALPRLGANKTISIDKVVAIDLPNYTGSREPLTFKHNVHSALFDSGTVLADDVRIIEALRTLLVKIRRDDQIELEKKQTTLASLDQRIQDERDTLSVLEAHRSEAEDDYAAAQRLLAEHWQEIELAYARRKQIIENHKGLYYVRVRETPLARTLPDPLDLRWSGSDDIVPGCPSEPGRLPTELQPFLDAVFDIPASEWAALEPLAPHLPGRPLLAQQIELRRKQLDIKRAQTSGLLDLTKLGPLLQAQRTMLGVMAARPFGAGSLRDVQEQAHRILALADLLSSPNPVLRDPAHKLQQQLVSAAACLLPTLRSISPSIRLTWANLADADQLPVETPQRWPLIARAEAQDFNTLRTLFDLISWWFDRLAASASGESRGTMRNLVRACLLLAADDDPQQLLKGKLKTLPPRMRVGELLHLDLNREPAPGNVLHVLDEQQQVVASVRVEDHDDKGTLVSLASIVKPGATLSIAMRVTGRMA